MVWWDSRSHFCFLVSVETCFVTNIWSIMEYVPWGNEKKAHSFVFLLNVRLISVRSIWFIHFLFKSLSRLHIIGFKAFFCASALLEYSRPVVRIAGLLWKHPGAYWLCPYTGVEASGFGVVRFLGLFLLGNCRLVFSWFLFLGFQRVSCLCYWLAQLMCSQGMPDCVAALGLEAGGLGLGQWFSACESWPLRRWKDLFTGITYQIPYKLDICITVHSSSKIRVMTSKQI